MVQMSPTSPAASYRPTYGVTYQGQMQPTSGVPMAPTSRTPLPNMLNPPRPGMPPARPAGVMPGMQQPTMGMPSLTPAAGGALAGTNGLAGAPGGYSAMPGGFAGGYAGATGAPPAGGILGASGGLSGQAYSDAKLGAYRDYDPINLGPVGGLLASAAGMASPVLGLLNTGRHIYNTEETAAYQSKFGQPMGFWDRLLGYFGLSDAGAGSISVGGQTLNKSPAGTGMNNGGMKSRNPDGSLQTSAGSLHGTVTGYKDGYAPGQAGHGTTGRGDMVGGSLGAGAVGR